jgi:hypothetical protein
MSKLSASALSRLPHVSILITGFLLISFNLSQPSFIWAKDFYVDNQCPYNGDGTAQTCAFANGQPGPFNSIGNAQIALTGDQSDNKLLLRNDRLYREQYNVLAFGSDNHPFIIGSYGAGNIPIIRGSELLDKASDWVWDNSDPARSLWYAKINDDPGQIFINGARAIRLLTKGDLDKEAEWYYDQENKRIYIFSVSNPSTGMIEVSTRLYGIYVYGKRYITIRNIQVEKTMGSGFRIEGDSHYLTFENVIANENYYSGMSVYPGNYCIGGMIQQSIFSGNGGSGLNLISVTNWTIRQNNTSNNCQLSTVNEAHNWTAGIKMNGTATANNIIENNISSGNTKGRGIWLDFCGTGNVIRYNKTCENRNAGIFNEITSGTEIYYNISCNNIGDYDASGIYIEGRNGQPPSGGQATNVKIFNNVIYGNEKFGLIMQNGDGVKGSCFGNSIKNNIIVRTTNGPNLRVGGKAEQEINTFENNCFGEELTNFIEWGWGVYKSGYVAWETVYGSSTTSVKADPQMVNPSKEDFRLNPTSPCIGAGTFVSLTNDYAGVYLPVGKAPDIGAYKYTTNISPPKNLRLTP